MYLVSKKKLTHDAVVETEAHKIASRFYPFWKRTVAIYAIDARVHYQQRALPVWREASRR